MGPSPALQRRVVVATADVFGVAQAAPLPASAYAAHNRVLAETFHNCPPRSGACKRHSRFPQ